MNSEILEEIGLSPNEAKIYETLVSTGPASLNKLSVESNVHRRNVYDCVDKLIKKGLVAEEFISGTKFVSAVNPSRLLDIVREKETKVNSILPGLQERFKAKMVNDKAVIYRGIEGFKNYLKDILEEDEPVYFIGAKAFWLDERLKYFVPKFDNERVKQGIHFKHIYDWEVKSMAPEILDLRLNEYKFFPKEASSAVAIDVFGDHVVTFYGVSPGHLAESPVQFNVVSGKIADGYRKYFNFMWKKLGKAEGKN
ncbi:MAG: helix-turn-helix domain-containing protein [Candidatus Diapherotrites archaeon]